MREDTVFARYGIAFLTGGGLFVMDADVAGPVDARSASLVKISDRGSYSTLNWSAPASGGPAVPAPTPASPGGGTVTLSFD